MRVGLAFAFGIVTILNILIGIVLVGSAIKIRHSIKRHLATKTNDRLVIIHIVNFTLHCLQSAIAVLIGAFDNDTMDRTKGLKLEFSFIVVDVLGGVIYEVYMDLFLLYLLTKFAEASKNAE